MPTKKEIDEWSARSQNRRANIKVMADADDIEGLRKLVAGMEEWEDYTRKSLGFDDK